MSRLLKRAVESFRGQVFTRLFFFFILLILASFSMMGFFIRYAVAAIILEKNESYVKNSLFQMRDAFESSLRQVDANVKYLYTSFFFEHPILHYLEGVHDPEQELVCTQAIVSHLSRLKNSSPHIVGVVLSYGEKTFSTYYPALKNSYDFSRYLYKERILEKNYESFITPLVVPDYYINYRKPVVTLGRNIKGRDLKTDIAILLVDIDLGIFGEITNRFPEKTGGDYYFVDARGILYHDAKGDRTGFAVTQETPLDHFSSVRGSEDFGVSMAGKMYYYAVRSMLTGGLLICRIPRNLLLEGVDAIQLWISLIMVFTVLLASVIAYVISRTFALRVRNIVESAELLGRGKFDIPISVSGEDELGRIGRSFNRMREELKRFIEKAYVAELANKELALKEKAAEIETLQMQINPHFLYNTLEAIRVYARTGESEKAAEMIRILAGIFRWNMRPGDNLVPLSEELEYARTYLELQKMRYKDRIEISMDIHLDASSVSCMKFLLEPLIENAIVHGLEKTSDPVRIAINASVRRTTEFDGTGKGASLLLEVRDSGSGIPAGELADLKQELSSWESAGSSHVGLRNVQGRIKLAFGDPYGVYIESEKGSGVTVRIELPYLPLGAKRR